MSYLTITAEMDMNLFGAAKMRKEQYAFSTAVMASPCDE